MTRVAVFLFVAALIGAPQQRPVFRSRADGVTIQVSVHAGNRPVAGLTATDFELVDNGVRQEITSLSLEQVPLDLTLLLDASVSVEGAVLQRLKTAVRDTANLLKNGDRIRLIAVSHVLREVFGLRARGETLPLDDLVAEGATSLYDGLAAAMMRPSDPDRRQLIVAFTDGRDSSSIMDETTLKDIARRTDAVVDLVVPFAGPGDNVTSYGAGPAQTGAGASPGQMVTGDPTMMTAGARALMARRIAPPAVLGELVGPTAGQIILLESYASISSIFKRTLEDFRASYVLQYIPQGVPQPGWHDVTVAVKRPGKYDVRARKGYSAGDR